jgi:predicted 3-demethylubiquinone-9 3-methyltransferase (glyoxalase superfamily)
VFVPSALPAMLTDADRTKCARVIGALMKMKKFDVSALERAFAGEF